MAARYLKATSNELLTFFSPSLSRRLNILNRCSPQMEEVRGSKVREGGQVREDDQMRKHLPKQAFVCCPCLSDPSTPAGPVCCVS